jgi:DHA1 family bicyclomycin/chloramphenicol resistance-like MFS transporter
VLLAIAATGTGGLFGVAVPLWAVLFATGLALPNGPALALSGYGESAGSAAALLGAVQFGVGAAVSPLVGVLGNDAVAMGIAILGSLALAVLVLLAIRPWRLPDPQDDELAVAGH